MTIRPAVLLHGFTGCPAAWDRVVACLPEKTRAAEIRRPWLAGHHPDLLDAGASFDDEVARLARDLPAEPCHLAGYSLGGRLALGLLVAHPERFASATLIGVHPGLEDETERRARALADETLAHDLLRHGIEWFVDHWQTLPLFRSQLALPRRVLAEQRAWRLAHDAEGLVHALRILGLASMPNLWPRLGELDLPVTLLVGDEDEKFLILARAVAAALPRARVEIVPLAGHNLPLETPAAVAAALAAGIQA